jgi:hypothetical protein
MMDSRSSSEASHRRFSDTDRQRAPELRVHYRRVFIVDSRSRFAGIASQFDAAADLVLTYDFGLKTQIERAGGSCFYVDQLCNAAEMQTNNFRVADFFNRWHLDSEGHDIFSYRDIPFGFSFRLEYWNDLLFYVRTFLCLSRVETLDYEALFVGTDLGQVEEVLDDLGVEYVAIGASTSVSLPSYFFPIHQWMHANIRHRGIRANIVNCVSWCASRFASIADRVRGLRASRPAVFVQDYYPTAAMIRRMRREERVRVFGAAPARGHLFERFIPVSISAPEEASQAEQIMRAFRAKRSARLVLASGVDVTDGAMRIIESRVAPRVAASLRIIDATLTQLRRDPFRLVLLIANIGDIVTLVDCVCRAQQIPSFLIINGLLGHAYSDESKRATVINAYSTSIRDNYFRGMDNIVCLGDPRMDSYPPAPPKSLDPLSIRVTIGASGFNPTDLNSYVAVEFEFLAGALEAIRRVRSAGVSVDVLLKIRANGYFEQYRRFVDEYFPGEVSAIIDQQPIRDVLTRTDIFVTIFSQTLFEASCMGIPVVYYRVGDVFKSPPFDGDSELQTVDSVDELVTALHDARQNHPRFAGFLDRKVMERYVGPLDGQNLQRNLDFVYEMSGAPDRLASR